MNNTLSQLAISRELFNLMICLKNRNSKNYRPGKKTNLLLAGLFH